MTHLPATLAIII